MPKVARVVSLLVFLLCAVPSAASAVEPTGEGVNVTHVRNISHTEARNDKQTNQGTDLELATITVAGPPAAAPGKPSTAAAPGTPAAPAGPKAAPKRTRARYVRKCRTVKRKRHGKVRKVRVCKRVKVRAKARKADADPHTPGVQKTFAFAGSYYDGIDVVDVTDPADARRVTHYDCGVGQGDVQVFQRDGRWFVVYAQDDGYDMFESTCTQEAAALGFKPTEADGGAYIVEVTNPYKPRLVSFVSMPAGTLGGAGSHNITVHPSGKYFYNSNADLITSALPAIEIVDLTDLSKPKIISEFALKSFPGLGTEAHDITFSADGKQAYVAALSHGEILDTTDPAKPVSISTIVDPALNVWHQAEVVSIDDPILGARTFLIGEDEFAGAEHTGQCPNGGLHVYDVTTPAAPVKVGAFNIDEVRPTDPTDAGDPTLLGRCTSHVFQIDQQTKVMTMGWYNAGLRVLDLNALAGLGIADKSPMGIRQIGWFQFKDTDLWAAKTVGADPAKGFYVFGNDKRRGFDVYRFDAKAGATGTPGTWLSPAQALERAQNARAKGPANLSGVCFIAPRSS
jgi:hypothetical protein